MKRSVWKVPFVSPCFFSRELKDLKSYSRGTLITFFFLKKKLKIFSGRAWIQVFIERSMVGCKLGEFSLTKIMGSAILVSMSKKEKEKIQSKTGRR